VRAYQLQAGAITTADDFALKARNTIKWSLIPLKELNWINGRFQRLAWRAKLVIPEGVGRA